jgi:hypothetical protein
LAQFLCALRISSVDDHPLVRALADRVGEQVQPISYVADDAFEGVVYGLIEDYAAKQAALSQPTLLTRPASGTEPAPVQQSPETAAERGGHRDRPARIARHGHGAARPAPGQDLATTLVTLLACRLTAGGTLCRESSAPAWPRRSSGDSPPTSRSQASSTPCSAGTRTWPRSG